MPISIGLVGLPNAGKTTLFNAITSAAAAAESYPFCTVDKNVAVVTVPDERLVELAKRIDPEEVAPTSIEMIDIAGLVKGASRGEGLGNKFLEDIRGVDAIFHIVRCFDNPIVARIEESEDPAKALGLVDTELILSDLELAERRIDQAKKRAKANRGEKSDEVEFYQGVVTHLEGGAPLSSMDMEQWERDQSKGDRFLTSKPCMIVLNIGEADLLGGNDALLSIRSATGQRAVFDFPAGVESEIKLLEPEDRGEFFHEFGLAGSRVPALLRAGFELLDLITFYTVARNKLHAWRIRRGQNALEAAALIHSDMADGFIRADVCSSEDLIEYGTTGALRSAGKIRSEGKEYEVADGDILFIHFQAKQG